MMFFAQSARRFAPVFPQVAAAFAGRTLSMVKTVRIYYHFD